MARYAKFVIAAIGAATIIINTLWGPDSQAAHILSAVVAAATALGVYAVPNKP